MSHKISKLWIRPAGAKLEFLVLKCYGLEFGDGTGFLHYSRYLFGSAVYLVTNIFRKSLEAGIEFNITILS